MGLTVQRRTKEQSLPVDKGRPLINLHMFELTTTVVAEDEVNTANTKTDHWIRSCANSFYLPSSHISLRSILRASSCSFLSLPTWRCLVGFPTKVRYADLVPLHLPSHTYSPSRWAMRRRPLVIYITMKFSLRNVILCSLTSFFLGRNTVLSTVL
jgi:hypothetical protein